MLRNRVIYALMIIVILLIHIFTNTYYSLVLLSMCVILPLASLVMLIIAGSKLSVDIKVPTLSQSDTAIMYELNNRSILPISSAEFVISIDNRMTGLSRFLILRTYVASRRVTPAEVKLADCCPGTLDIITRDIKFYDFFGIISIIRRNLPLREVLVYPKINQVELVMSEPVEVNAEGNHFSPYYSGNDISEIFALREYAPGDEIRKIHWKLSSKLEQITVRDYSRPLNYPVFLLVELRRGAEELTKVVIEMYFAIAYRLLDEGINYTMGWYDDAEGEFCVKEIDSYETLELSSASVLSSHAGEYANTALDCYINGNYQSKQTILIYITPEPDAELIAELEVVQYMSTICIHSGDTPRMYTDIDKITDIAVNEDIVEYPEIVI